MTSSNLNPAQKLMKSLREMTVDSRWRMGTWGPEPVEPETEEQS